jgi:hypothetical protein
MAGKESKIHMKTSDERAVEFFRALLDDDFRDALTKHPAEKLKEYDIHVTGRRLPPDPELPSKDEIENVLEKFSQSPTGAGDVMWETTIRKVFPALPFAAADVEAGDAD